MKLSDADAKRILLTWPQRTATLWKRPNAKGYWLRASPSSGTAAYPHLSAPGATAFRTNPDGLYVYFHDCRFCDVICIESCGTGQNLHDKRSRYFLASHSLLLIAPVIWLHEKIRLQRASMTPRWEATRCFRQKPQTDLILPVRHLRVLFALEDNLYSQRKNNHVPPGHEYYCRHSSLDSHTAESMREFLSAMSLESHYLTTR
jgi:hypothetical protein